MDWISGIQKALNYAEEHITENIDYDAVAKQAYSSQFHFERMFGMLCGFSLGEYVRNRRLSLAGEELSHSKEKIIDIAMKYGYDTPEGFSRAFTKFHGITPTEARKGKTVKTFSKLSVKLILSGGNTMNYRIEKKDALKIVCKKKQVNKPQGDTATTDISAFWAECGKDGTMQKICKYAKFDNLHGVLGVCFSGEMANNGFPYGIGAEYNGTAITDDGLDVVEIPSHTYAIFECRGKMPEAFVRTYKQICEEFFPQSSYEYGNGVELEVYPSDDTSSPDYYCEIWIAVNEKKTAHADEN